MTRKQRNQTGQRNITYDLSNPRNIVAFEALLHDEEDEEELVSQSSRPSKATRQQQGRKKREKEKFFMLKADAADRPASAAQPASQHDQLLLIEMFGGAADRSLISDVYHASGCSVEAAAEALFGLLGGVEAGPSQPLGNAAGSSSSPSFAAAAAAGGPLSSSAAAKAAAAATLACQQQHQQQEAMSVSWGDLPPDVRSTILSQLTPQDLARAASTCGEFRDWANAMRAHVRHLVLQPGVSYSCLKGMVSSHVAAGVMDFSRFERHIAKQDPKELLPQVVAMHKAEAEASLFRGVLAVAEGSTAPCRTVPVTGLILRGLVGVTDRLVAEALQNLKGLRSLDISHCPNVTNKSFYLIAKYQANTGLSKQHTQQQHSPQKPGMPLPRRPQQQQQQQQGPQADSEDEEELEYGWAGSSSSSEDTDTDDDDNSSGSVDGADEPGELDNATAVAPAGAEAAAAAGVDSLSYEAAQAEEESVPEPSRAGVDALTRPDTSTSTTAAATLNRKLAALEIQAALFHQPHVQLVGAGDAEPLAAEDHTAAEEVPTASAAAAAAAAAAGVGLRELKLAGSRCLMDDGLRQVLQHPSIKHSLAKLDISNCRSISSAGLVVPPLGVLRELKACRVSGLKQLVLHLPSTHPLCSLDLSQCHYLQLLDLHLAGLTTVNISACRTLYRLRMRCPSLQSLSLAQCGNLFDFHEDAWEVPALQQLNMYGCRRASGTQLQVVLDKLAALQWISLNGCYGITTLHLTRNLELQSVDLSGCRFLSAFSCASPVLQQLTAASCSRLNSLTLSSNSMRVLLLPNCKQLAVVHVSVPPAAEVAEAAGAAVDARRGRGQRAEGEAGSSSGSGKGQSTGRGGRPAVLDTKGCVSLSAEGRARLVAAMALGR